MYKTEVITTARNINKRAQKVEELVNKKADEGYSLVTMCSTPNFGVILVFKKD